MTTGRRTLILALGNELAGDDAVGLIAARKLRELNLPGTDVVETGEAGLALLDHMAGYDRVVILDAIVDDSRDVGTVLRFDTGQLRSIESPSPHYAGLPDVQRVAHLHGIPYPHQVTAAAVVIRQPVQLAEGLSEEVQKAVPWLVHEALRILEAWDHLASEEP